eukprot:1754523-Prymnesium_polylepis.1
MTDFSAEMVDRGHGARPHEMLSDSSGVSPERWRGELSAVDADSSAGQQHAGAEDWNWSDTELFNDAGGAEQEAENWLVDSAGVDAAVASTQAPPIPVENDDDSRTPAM